MSSQHAEDTTPVEVLRAEAASARTQLLASLTGLTERDFSARTDGGTVTELLAALVRTEHAAIQQARASAGLPARPSVEVSSSAGRPLPPQVMHGLAGTRHELGVLLDDLAQLEESPTPDVLRAIREGVVAPELKAARRIAEATSARAQPGGDNSA